jgi:hypothetical protein
MDKKLQEQCICPMCPSFVKCGEQPAFCLPEVGVSKCIKSEVGCVCPGCPVYEKMGFNREYFCIR